jgi:hypothetical protein
VQPCSANAEEGIGNHTLQAAILHGSMHRRRWGTLYVRHATLYVAPLHQMTASRLVLSQSAGRCNMALGESSGMDGRELCLHCG